MNDFDPAPDTFDLIVLSAVLEHICDLQATLLHIRRMLSRDGLVFVSVPDASRFSKDDDAPFQHFSIEHVNYFSGTSLNNCSRWLV